MAAPEPDILLSSSPSAGAQVFFLSVMEAPKDPVVVSEEAYALQHRSRSGINPAELASALAGASCVCATVCMPQCAVVVWLGSVDGLGGALCRRMQQL